jgi:hypothetical protein
MSKFGRVLRKINKKFGQVGKTLSKVGQVGLSTGALINLVAPEIGLPLMAISGGAIGIGEIGKHL